MSLVGRFSPQRFCIGIFMSDKEFFKEMIERDFTLRVDKEIREATATVIAFSILMVVLAGFIYFLMR